MLVNHLAKRHPDVSMETVPELNLPILRSQRDYFCQYCDKVYKSSSKRKSHIVKNHPGAELPASARKQFSECPGLPNPTFSAPTGHLTTMPHRCNLCHKQYATKAKLIQHHRKKHDGKDAQTNGKPLSIITLDEQNHKIVAATAMIAQCIGENGEIQLVQQANNELQLLPEADLLTQAMSELTRSFEYRVATGPGATDYQTMVPCLINTSSGTATIVQTISSSSTAELNQLGQQLSQQLAQIQMQHQDGLPIQLDQQQQQNSTQIIQVPISLSSTYLQRAWNGSNNYQSF